MCLSRLLPWLNFLPQKGHSYLLMFWCTSLRWRCRWPFCLKLWPQRSQLKARACNGQGKIPIRAHLTKIFQSYFLTNSMKISFCYHPQFHEVMTMNEIMAKQNFCQIRIAITGKWARGSVCNSLTPEWNFNNFPDDIFTPKVTWQWNGREWFPSKIPWSKICKFPWIIYEILPWKLDKHPIYPFTNIAIQI